MPAGAGSRRADHRSGQMLTVVAVFLIAMLGVLGLVTDTGIVEANRRHAQRAADAAAQAGAREMLFGQLVLVKGGRSSVTVAIVTDTIEE